MAESLAQHYDDDNDKPGQRVVDAGMAVVEPAIGLTYWFSNLANVFIQGTNHDANASDLTRSETTRHESLYALVDMGR